MTTATPPAEDQEAEARKALRFAQKIQAEARRYILAIRQGFSKKRTDNGLVSGGGQNGEEKTKRNDGLALEVHV